MDSPDKLLVVGLNWIGDAVMSLPVLRAIKRNWPQTEILVACRGWNADIYRLSPLVDTAITLQKRGGLARISNVFANANKMKASGADAVLVLPNSFSSALMARLSGIKERIGYRTDGRGLLMNRSCDFPADFAGHTVLRYKQLLKQCMSLEWSEEDERFEMELDESSRHQAVEILESHGLDSNKAILGVSAGAAWGPAKAWPPDNFAETITQLLAKRSDLQVVLFGSPEEQDLNQSIIEGFEGRAANLAGAFPSLNPLVATIDACSLLLCNDSGPMHIATAMGTPVVALFGPSDESKTGPWAPASRATVLRAPGSKPWIRFRPDSDEPWTMANISVETVVQAVWKLLESN